MVRIESGNSRADISEEGGSLSSVVFGGEEYLWQGDERSWKSRDIVIFPFIARLRDGWYEADGRRYEMNPHGLARHAPFSVVERTGDRAVLRLRWTEETLLRYPYRFVLDVSYAISGDSLSVDYSVRNEGDAAMPFALGTHFGWRLDGTEDGTGADTSGNFVEFERTPEREYVFDDDTHLVTGKRKWERGGRMELAKDLFLHDAVVSENLSRTVTLFRRGGRRLRFDVGNAPVLAFWSKVPFGRFVCVEAWHGLPDFLDCDRELARKPLINVLPAGEEFVYAVKVSLLP